MAVDFEYDGLLLSDFGYRICSFDSSGGIETVPGGSKITFTAVPVLNGTRHLLAGVEYTECISCTFSICKSICGRESNGSPFISIEELTELSRWLNRKEFRKFRPMEDGYENIYFEGSFNLDTVKLDGKIIGLELTFTSNRPFAVGERLQHKFHITRAGQSVVFSDRSDEIGFIYMDTDITCNASGTLVIHNDIEGRDTIIKNCSAGEAIRMSYPIISTSLPSHKIQNDFNYNFPRIANRWNTKANRISFSLPCSGRFSYHPIRKAGISWQ